FSRSVGAGRAATRNTRGLTRSVMALITPPLPAPSRPSNTTQIFSPLSLTHSCRLTSSSCSSDRCFSYTLRLSFSPALPLPMTWLLDARGYDLIVQTTGHHHRPGPPSLVHAADLRALQPQPGHQSLLVEEDRVHILLRRGGGEGLRRAGVEDDDARSDAQLEAPALGQILNGGVGHEEQGVAEHLDPRLETIGGRGGIVVADRLAPLAQRPLAVLRPEHEP